MAKSPKKPGKKASPAPKAASAKKSDAAAAKAAARQEAARGKLERVKVPQSRRDDSTEGKYVYCVIRSEQPLSFGPLGLGPEPAEVHTIHFRDIAAVVSNTPIVVQDPTRENVLAHQRVNETVMQKHTVIPMSFGTVFKTDDDIMELLRSAYDAFSDVLSKMQEKFEFGLKVLWDRDQIIREIEEEDEDIRRLKSEISSQKGSTYFARMQYGRLIDAALQSRTERYVSDRRPDDHERRLPGLARDGAGFRRPGQGDRSAVREADLQVHRPVAALQLRQYQAETGTGALRRAVRAAPPSRC